MNSCLNSHCDAVVDPPQEYRSAVRCAVEFFRAGHMLFGTDMPLGGPGVVAETIADVESLGLGAADRALVYEGDARAILGLTDG
jgi:hypothetical protein